MRIRENEDESSTWRKRELVIKKRDIGLNSILHFCTNKHDVYWSVAKSH